MMVQQELKYCRIAWVRVIGVSINENQTVGCCKWHEICLTLCFLGFTLTLVGNEDTCCI